MRHIEKIKLETDEHILLEVRKHWFVITLQWFAIILIAILPLFIYTIFALTKILLPVLEQLSIGVLLALYACWLVGVWMALFNVWTNYYLDVWTITNKRLITVDQRGFFFRKTASFRFDRLQDVAVSVNGLLATLLDYGTIEIATASEGGIFKVSGLPKPQEIKATILKATDEMRGTNTAPDQITLS
jgi:membrane protein YdbS with pleckstrin-like domain